MARAPANATTADAAQGAAPRGRARDKVKDDLKTLKKDVREASREESDRLRDMAARADADMRVRAEELRQQARRYYDEGVARGREYYDDASERFDEYQRYLSERVQERPLQSTGIALGVGVIIGLLLAGGRR